jgi:uncharacterized protein
MATDLWHYPRTPLAEQVLGLFESGLSSAFVFFAPRRMGKTEFLRKDIFPLANHKGWKTFYFSFLDAGPSVITEFTRALTDFSNKTDTIGKTRGLLQRISKISGEAVGIKANVELNASLDTVQTIKEVIEQLTKKGTLLLLLDEVQALAQDPANAHFIAALRTALDIHKDTVKVIFTGSSQEGLRRMFSQAKAPFFHFGQKLPFPELDRGFTDHLVSMFEKVTTRQLDSNALWSFFQETQKIPQLARSLVERLALHPSTTLETAQQELLAEIFAGRAFSELWERCSTLEKLLLHNISIGNNTLFARETRKQLAKQLGIQELPVSSVQSAIRVLQRKGFIGRPPENSGYFIDDPNFKNWLTRDDG